MPRTEPRVPSYGGQAHASAIPASIAVACAEATAENIADAQDRRPVNTSKNYDPKAEEYLKWCRELLLTELEEPTRLWVTPAKSALFMKQRVVGRQYLPRTPRDKERARAAAAAAVAARDVANKRPTAAAQKAAEAAQVLAEAAADEGVVDESGKKVVGPPTVKLYVAALVDLWNLQLDKGMHTELHPRTTCSVIIDKALKDRIKSDKLNHTDRLTNTCLDGYTFDELIKVANVGLNANDWRGLRNRAMHLLMHSLTLRGENVLGAELPDLQFINLPNEGSTWCPTLILVMTNGKTVSDGRAQIAGAMRHQDWRVCPLGALSFWFFWCFHDSSHTYKPESTSFPSMADPSHWYGLPVFFPATTRSKDHISSSAFQEITREHFKKAGVRSKRNTHAARASAAQFADLSGASEAALRRGGRWDQSAMVTAYVGGLSPEYCRVLGGWKKEGGAYWVRRAVDVPEALLFKFFPEARQWLAKMDSNDAGCAQSPAGHGFLTLMLNLATICIQDAVMLLQQQPDHFMLQHELFQSVAFQEYATHSIAAQAAALDPTRSALAAVVPLVATRLDIAQADSERRHVLQQRQMDALSSDIAALKDGMASCQGAVLQAQQTSMTEFSCLKRIALQCANGNIRAVTHVEAVGEAVGLMAEVAASLEAPQPTPAVAAQGVAVGDVLRRGTHNVVELWQEWQFGVLGRPAVRQIVPEGLNAHQFNWRGSVGNSERKFYRGRLSIIQEMERQAESQGLEKAIVCQMMDRYRALNKGMSLDQLLHSISERKHPTHTSPLPNAPSSPSLPAGPLPPPLSPMQPASSIA